MKHRRSFLAAASSMGTLSLAGCIAGDLFGSDDEDPTENETDSEDEPDNDSNNESDEDQPNESENNSDSVLTDLPGEAIDDFEDIDAWTAMNGQGEISDEVEDVYAGDRSARLTAGEDIDYAGAYRSFPDGLDLQGKNFSLAVKYTGREQFTINVQLLAPNSRNVVSLRRTLTGPADSWQRVDLGVNNIGTEPDLGYVQEIRIIGRRRGDQTGDIDFLVDDLRAVDSPDQGAVMLLFDGTLESHYTNAFEITQEFGFPAVESIIPETVGNDGRLTLDVMSEMSDAGWDMVARPHVGARFMTEFTPAEQEGNIRAAKTYLERRGFADGARHIVIPKNLVGPETMDLISEYHEQGFRFGGAPNALPATDPHNLGTFSGESGNDTRHFVDMAARYNQLAVLRFGEIGEDGFAEDDLRDLLEYIDEQDVRVVTASEILDS